MGSFCAARYRKGIGNCTQTKVVRDTAIYEVNKFAPVLISIGFQLRDQDRIAGQNIPG
jgi:hypothetical protein